MSDNEGAAGRRWSDSQWHLDKRVPVAMILAIVIQTGGAVWWAAQQSAATDTLKARVIRLETQNEQRDDQMRAISDRLARLEENAKNQLRTLERIRDSLERQNK